MVDVLVDAVTNPTLHLVPRTRQREGAATAEELRQRCGNVCGLVTRMEEIRAGAVNAFQKRLKEKLADLLHGAGIDPQRLAQEAALLADRSDIAEELMRLRTHAGQVVAMLAGGGEVGKRLDFLLQEMNRESNTVLSKTGGLGVEEDTRAPVVPIVLRFSEIKRACVCAQRCHAKTEGCCGILV